MADYKDNSNDRLEKLLAEYKKNNTIEKLTELAEELRVSKVHLPCKTEDDNRIAAMMMKMQDGNVFIPVYTSKWHLNGKLQSGSKVAVIPYTEVNKIAVTESKVDKLNGIIVNPGDSNIILNMNFINKMFLTEEASQKKGEKIALDFTNPLPQLDNTGLEDQMESFASEQDNSIKQNILNGILNTLRDSQVVIPLGINKAGKNAPLVMTNNNTGDKFMPVYTNAAFAAKRHQECKIGVYPFDKANEIALSMKTEVDGMCVISEKVTVNLKTRLLENVKEVNDKIRAQKEGAANAKAQVNKALEEQVKFTMVTVPGILEKRGQKFIDALLERRAAYIDELYENAYYDIRMYPYVEEEFAVTAITAAPTVDAIEVEYPKKGSGVGAALRAYIIWDSEKQQGRYFAITKSADDALMIMEVSEGTQTCHGISAIETNEMSRVLDIVGI